MHIAELLFLSVALGMDCLIVSFSQGLILLENKLQVSFLLALVMGLMQGLMPSFTYFGTGLVSKYLESYSNWIVFLIFAVMGIKFIYEAFKNKESQLRCVGIECLLIMGVATSIDAFASGIGLKLTNTPFLLAMFCIGLVSFLMSLFGFWFGNFFKKLPGKYLEILGGLILIILAVKTVI